MILLKDFATDASFERASELVVVDDSATWFYL